MSHSQLFDNERQRVCLIPIPALPHLTEKKREAGVYISGGLFAIGWWFFIDAVVYSNYLKSDDDSVPVMNFEDWICGILINMYARLFLFVGFAALAGGLAGSFTILILKYIVIESPHTYFGIALIIQNLSIMFSTFILWIAQSADDESGYRNYL
ncbi:11652_t:CDS:2 [Rhizophagus irregularis]|nr:11652_t:CDS:2 [Rhizophagus irregularis]